MRNGKDGAVSIVMIIFVLLTLIFAGTSYWMFSESESFKKTNQDLVLEIAAMEDKFKAEKEKSDRLEAEKVDLNNKFIRAQEESESFKRQYNTAKTNREEVEREIESLRGQHSKQLDSKQKYIDELRGERNDLKNRVSSVEAQFSNDKDNFIKKIEKLEEEKQATIKAQRDVMAEKNTRIRQLEGRIKQLIGRRAKQLESIEADGTIVTANNDKRLVGLDLGRKENLKVGTKFEVFQIRGGGKYVAKGMIEVKEVQEDVAFGYILQLNNLSDPIIPGDLIGSPIYDKNETKKFYVAGDFETYQAEDVKRLIEESGGEVVEEIDLYTDFVVLGVKNVGTAKNEAIEVGVVMMNESQLIKYLMD